MAPPVQGGKRLRLLEVRELAPHRRRSLFCNSIDSTELFLRSAAANQSIGDFPVRTQRAGSVDHTRMNVELECGD